MSDWHTMQSSSTQILDWIFARAGGDTDTPPPGAGEAARPGLAEMSPAPSLHSRQDLQAAIAWLQRERQRLEGYTQSQLARLQQEHQSLVAQNYQNEQALISRAQELSRTEEMLTAHQAMLANRLAELEARCQATEQAEAAAQRRLAEIEALEARLI